MDNFVAKNFFQTNLTFIKVRNKLVTFYFIVSLRLVEAREEG